MRFGQSNNDLLRDTFNLSFGGSGPNFNADRVSAFRLRYTHFWGTSGSGFLQMFCASRALGLGCHGRDGIRKFATGIARPGLVTGIPATPSAHVAERLGGRDKSVVVGNLGDRDLAT
jgi:hypothetical protein